jgi:hypothetical protein
MTPFWNRAFAGMAAGRLLSLLTKSSTYKSISKNIQNTIPSQASFRYTNRQDLKSRQEDRNAR